MVYQRRIIVTESERNRIMGLYENNSTIDFVISDWLSPDEKFVIFLDELYDIENKIKLGNVFEDFNLFTKFLKHSFEVSKDVSQEIKESVLESINKIVINESNRNISELKTLIKEQNWFKDSLNSVKNFAVNTYKGAVSGVTDFVTTSIEGAKKLYKNISDGQWSEVLNLIKKGALYVARKIRAALYNPIGIILDAILIATGIGKSAQFVIWAVVVALDVYELVSGDYEDKETNMLVRLLFFGIDILGMVTAGAVASAGKGLVSGLLRKFGKSTSGLGKAIKESPAFKSILEKMLNGAKSASGFMQRAANFLKTKSPMMYKFISGIMGGLLKFVNGLVTTIEQIFKAGGVVLSAPGKVVQKVIKGGAGKASGAVANALVPVTAMGAYGEYRADKSNKELNNAIRNSQVKADYENFEF